MKEINSHIELTNELADHQKLYLLLWKSGAELSQCAFEGLKSASAAHPEIAVLSADVGQVRDIHPAYGVTSAPSLLQFEDGKLKNVIKGCHQSSFFHSLLEEAVYQAKAADDGISAKSVTVYTTPTCTWCNTLKQWLRKNHIQYHEIDVSRDERAAQELVRKTGQQGVPQTDINGQIVVGFDQVKLKQLLEL
jgi:glutaredoxin-like YruB-family protein